MSEPIETSWVTREENDTISIVHDNRWLAIFGVPMCLFGLLVAVGPWLIEEARNSDDWPILAGGSVIGLGLFTAGLSLCFHYAEVVCDRRSGRVTQRKGLPPFQRTRSWPVDAFNEVVCETQTMASATSSSSLHHRMLLVGPNASVLLASCLEKDPIIWEGLRWSEFLGVPLRDLLNEAE